MELVQNTEASTKMDIDELERKSRIFSESSPEHFKANATVAESADAKRQAKNIEDLQEENALCVSVLSWNVATLSLTTTAMHFLGTSGF